MATQEVSNVMQALQANDAQGNAPLTAGKPAGKPVAPKCTVCGKPIAITNTEGIGSTCKGHAGKVGLYYKQAPADVATNKLYTTLVKLCDLAQELGYARGHAVKLTGGDAGTQPPTSPTYQCYVLGKRKYVLASALTAYKKAYAPKKA